METFSQKQQKNNNGSAGSNNLNLDQTGKKGKHRKKFFIQRVYDAFFAIMVELLKNKSIGQFTACLLLVIMFLQVNATLFDQTVSGWNDQLLLAPTLTISNYIHVYNAIAIAQNGFYYQILFYLALFYTLIMAGLLLYVHYALQYPQIYISSLITLLQVMLLLVYSVLFFPFCDAFVSIFQCDPTGTTQSLITDIQCYGTQHIVMVVVSVLGLALFLGINLMIATLYNETQPNKEDALSRLDSNFELIMLAYRFTMSVITIYCFQNFCDWIIILVSLLSSTYFTYNYFKFIPYYNPAVSKVFGSMVGVYCWVSVNALIMEVWPADGHITIIGIGVPVVIVTMVRLREHKIEWLMTTTLEKLNRDIDCLNQIMTLQDWLGESQQTNADIDKEIRVKGFINQHMRECQALECTCSRVTDLYDNQTDQFLTLARFGLEYEPPAEEVDEDEYFYIPRTVTPTKLRRAAPQQREQAKDELHRNEVFIQSFNRQLYKDALQKFVSSVSIHILFSYYYFTVMRNVHAALHELKIASKKRPNIYQQFTIYRYQNMIELYIKQESEKNRDQYEQLTNVKEFEKLFSEMSKQIERVCNHQVEFWTHLATVIPDLNHLNQLNEQIVNTSAEADKYWEQLSKINSDYPSALLMYAEYLSYIRNNTQAAKQYFDRAEKASFGAKAAHENAISKTELLFSDEVVIVHISGNRESSGRIVKTSQGLKKCFGWDKTEVMGQNVAILMSGLFGAKHNSFLEQYYHTARRLMFHKERSLFAAHKTGYCFQVNILIKQMPSLAEGIQYVGMIRPQMSDNDYIITDFNGYIDSFTSGIGLLFNINPMLVKDSSTFNIQFISPELVHFFNNRNDLDFDQSGSGNSLTFHSSFASAGGIAKGRQKGQARLIDNSRFNLPSGDTLTFYIPSNFLYIIKSENPVRGNQGNNRGGNNNASSKRFNDNANLTGASTQGTQSNKQSQQFKEFLKFIQRTGRAQGRRQVPDLKDLLKCSEYKNYDFKKVLQVEISECVIPMGNSPEKGLRMLLFKIPKNQQERKPNNGDNPSFDPTVRNQQQQDPEGQPPSHHNEGNKQNGNMQQQKSYKREKTFKRGATNNGRAPQQSLKKKKTRAGQASPTPLNQIHSFAPANNNAGGANKAGIKQAMSFEADGKSKSSHSQSHHTQTQSRKHSDQVNSTPKTSQKLPSNYTNSQLAGSAREPSLNIQTNSLKLAGLPDDPKARLGTNRGVGEGQPDKIDLELLKFERQETDDEEEDDQEQLETERIDVKKDIALNDEMKGGNPSEGEGNPEADSKMRTGTLMNQENVQKLFVDLQNPTSSANMDAFQFNSRGASTQGPGGIGQQSMKEQSSRIAVLARNQTPEQIAQSQQRQNTEQIPHIETEGVLPSTNRRKPRFIHPNHHPNNNVQQPYDPSMGNTTTQHNQEEDEEGGEYGDEGDGDDEGQEDFLDDEFDGDEYGEERGDEDDYGDQEDVLAGHDEHRSAGSQGEEDVLLGNKNIIITPGAPGNQVPRRSRGSRASLLFKSGSEFINDVQKNNSVRMSRRESGALMPTQSQALMHPGQPNKKLHDYARIVTNPRYKCFDEETCGSAYFNDCNASEKEIDIRETIKKRQIITLSRTMTQRRRKAKAAKVEEVKKAEGAQEASKDPDDDEELRSKQAKVEDEEASVDLDADEARRLAQPTTDVEDAPDDKADEAQAAKKKATGGDDFHDEGEVSSIASSIQSQTRTYYSLKQAIDEKYVPLQMRNLNFVANLVWFSILLLSVAYFFIQSTLFSQIQSYIQIIVNSEDRIHELMNLNLKLIDIALINEGALDGSLSSLQLTAATNLTTDQVISIYVQELLQSATNLKNAQTELSTQTASLPADALIRINPEGVTLQYYDVSGNNTLPSLYTFNIWEAIVQISVFVFRLAETPAVITHMHPDMIFISSNCMNSVLSALQESTQAIVDQSESARISNNNIFLILVISVSGALLLSMAFLLPVIKRAKDNKQEVFILLTHKKVEKQIEDQLKKCRQFISKYQQQSENIQDYEDNIHDNHMMNNAAQAIEENAHAHMPHEKDMKNQNDEKKDDYISKVKKQKRKWRPLNNNFVSIIIRFLLLLLLIESFFLYTYITSLNFLQEVSYLTGELRLLISRQPQLEFLLLMEKDLVNYNGSHPFLGQDVRQVAVTTIDQQNTDYESLLQDFETNYYSHAADYNQAFDAIMYSDVCNQITYQNLSTSQCEAINEGILAKGMYTSVVKYWTVLRRVLFDYLGSQIDEAPTDITQDNVDLQMQQQMMETLIMTSHEQLGQILRTDIDTSFKNQAAQNQTVFIIFLIYVIFVYLVVWRYFMQGLLEELWRAKTCLSVLPMDICFRIEEIRAFIYRNSSGVANAA